MELNQYQEEAKKTAVFPAVGDLSYVYPALGLSGEAGEVAEKIKKLIRDKGGLYTDEDVTTIKKELGDVLWYIAVLADSFGLTLNEVAQGNVDKLSSRQERNTLNGSGDDR